MTELESAAVPDDVQRLRGQLGAAIRFGYSDERVQAIRAEMAVAKAVHAIEELLGDSPVLSAEQADRLCATVQRFSDRTTDDALTA